MDIEGIPKELRSLSQFVVWRKERKKGRLTKIPYCPNTGGRADTTDPETWTDIDDALTALSSGGYDGIGFVFTKEAGIVGVDLDHCVTDGELSTFARGTVDLLDSYTEISPSGDGLHILIKGALPGPGINRPAIEMYQQGRFFTLTGNVVESRNALSADKGALATLYRRFAKPEKSQAAPEELLSTSTIDATIVDQFCQYDHGFDLWEKRIIHKSQSEYDLAIAGYALLKDFTEQQAATLIYLHRLQWEDHPSKALRTDYMRDTLAKARSGLLPKPSATPIISKGPFFVDAQAITSNPKGLSWIVKGHIPSTGLVWIAGQWSTKKTFLALHMCAHIAAGKEWCGQRVKQSRVVYLTGEGFNGISQRLKALELGLGLKVPEGWLHFTTTAVMINTEAGYRALVEHLREQVPDVSVIFVDTKAANMRGSDSDPGVMNDWVNMARALEREFDCVLIIIDHVGHAAKDRPRGASQQMGAADAVYMVECDRETDSFEVTLRTEKDPKDFQSPRELHFTARPVQLPHGYDDEDGVPANSLYLECSNPHKPTIEPVNPYAGLGAVSKSALIELKRLAREYKENVQARGESGLDVTVLMDHWKKACADAGIKPSTFQSIPETLAKRKLIEIPEGGKLVRVIEQ